MNTSEPHDNRPNDGPASPEYTQADAHDPDGLGFDIEYVPGGILIMPLFGLLFALVSLAVLWWVGGMRSALVMMGLFVFLMLVGAMPIWGAAFTQSREHHKFQEQSKARQQTK